ncbi:uncharacterized protein MKK02DRAFT_44205 [Dioszegia hungarica]|uniref:Uncharacterized protein n=1 Tax=Dioszegia hungarica TaxID=4972 RepID=A0AA38H748_9TREE|nr:uncharacterized protein MKK02DRAFT_44205 [Dioszegia hungarica]KAI9635515.1 hypothetical protein MKK02DRAFT_44205 [Dioszegia hungarica]
MEPNALDQLRRHRRFAIPLHLDVVADGLAKRLTPDQLASIQSEMSASAARATSAAAAALRPAQSTARAGANAATISTTVRSVVSTFSAVPNFTVGQPLANTPSTTPVPVPSSSSVVPSSSSTIPSSSARAIPSSSSTTPIPSSSATPTSTLPQVITRTTPITSVLDALPSASAEAANSSSSSSSMSTGTVVGVVLAVLVGVVILGSFAGWLYRKFAQRGYQTDSHWRKLDEDVTPFPQEKDEYNDDIYGGAAAPVIGSRRALADHAGRDASYPSSRPMTEYGSNRAGLGSGPDMYGAHAAGYPAPAATWGVDAQGRPYNGQAGRVPTHPYQDEYEYGSDRHSPPPPPSTRQLVGPGQLPQPELMPVALGRPAPPRSYSDIAFREDFADEPMTAGMPYEPMTARTNEWAGSAQHQPMAAQQSRRISGTTHASKSPSPPQPASLPLPTFAPLSPMDSSFAFQRQSQQPMAMYENEPARQKQLYGEVAAFAGFAEPKTPHSAGLDHSVSSNGTFNTGTTHSSFSATEHGVRLPAQPPVPAIPSYLSMPAPPYEHGRPLSAVEEVATPSTFRSTAQPLPSSSIGLGGHAREVNPFDNLPVPRTLVAPHSAASGSSFPSPRFPPPSPGGMSLPGSVSESPKRWSGQGTGNVGMARRSRGESMFDGDDAYGGI